MQGKVKGLETVIIDIHWPYGVDITSSLCMYSSALKVEYVTNCEMYLNMITAQIK
jgi:hypothetical protein